VLEYKTTALFRKDLKRAVKRNLPIHLLKAVIETLRAEEPLAPHHLDHALSGRYEGHRECHVLNDWLLIYKIDRGNLILTATRTGTHSDLFWT
jgi:mRNA interferase YafQ